MAMVSMRSPMVNLWLLGNSEPQLPRPCVWNCLSSRNNASKNRPGLRPETKR